MHDSILNFAKQLGFEPKLENGPVMSDWKHLIVGGMGGSHLSADLLHLARPALDIRVHNDYGLPQLEESDLRESLLVASSYSGNTEETLDFLATALAKGYKPAVIASGGKLLDEARKNGLPYVAIPNDIIQPRVAVGVSLKALAHICGKKHLEAELAGLSQSLQPAELEAEGKRIAEALTARIPLIYASSKNGPVAYNWKIKINETAKIAAFCHVLPELNHNELAGFSKNPKRPEGEFASLMLLDDTDHPRTARRFQVTAELLAENSVTVITSKLSGATPVEKALRSLVTADWTAYHLALIYGVNPDDNPTVEEFKKRILN